MWEGDTCDEFQEPVLRVVAPGVSHRLVVGNYCWAKDMVEYMVTWFLSVLNAAYRERYQACPYKISCCSGARDALGYDG